MKNKQYEYVPKVSFEEIKDLSEECEYPTNILSIKNEQVTGRKMNNLVIFKKIFWSAFQRPKLNSQRFNDLWLDLEGISDWLAGPLSGIYNNGNCDYVFNDKDDRFPGINSLESFLEWENDLLEEYREGIFSKEPNGLREKSDYEVLYQQTEVMEVLVNLAYEIQKERIEEGQ